MNQNGAMKTNPSRLFAIWSMLIPRSPDQTPMTPDPACSHSNYSQESNDNRFFGIVKSFLYYNNVDSGGINASNASSCQYAPNPRLKRFTDTSMPFVAHPLFHLSPLELPLLFGPEHLHGVCLPALPADLNHQEPYEIMTQPVAAMRT